MLVQLSPWETTSTTVQLASSVAVNRRRKRSNSDVDLTTASPQQQPQHHDDLSFAACFIAATTTRRARVGNKQQQHRKLINGHHTSSKEEEDFVPVLSVTTFHRVAVLGTTSNRAGGGQRQQQHEPSSSLKESSLLQFTSRPGSSTSFFQEAKTNGSSKHHFLLPKVPAIVDTRNNLVYALQKENSVLVCWNSLLASGPDDKDTTPIIKVKMESPVLCMSLVPTIQKGVLCGTCLNGRLFLAWWRDNDREKLTSEALQVEYFESNLPITGVRHQGTLVVQHTTEPNTKAVTTSLTQKAKDMNGHRFSICQVFSEDSQEAILGVYHEFSLSSTVDDAYMLGLQRNLVRSRTTVLSLLATPPKRSDYADDFLLVSMAGSSTLALVYPSHSCSKNGNSKAIQVFCAQVGMDTGNLIRTPIELPTTTRQAALVSPDLLAVGTPGHILLYDLRYGALVLSESLKDVIGTDQNNWKLLADDRRNRLAIVYSQEGHVHFGLTTAVLVGETDMPISSGISLACELRSSLVSTSLVADPAATSGRRPSPKSLRSISASCKSISGDRDMPSLTGVIEQSLKMLKDARADILNPDNPRIQTTFLLDVYEQAVARTIDHVQAREMLSSDLLSSQVQKANCVAGHAATANNVERTNGFHDVQNNNKKTVAACLVPKNGQHPPRIERQGHTPPSTPQKFIDGAVPIILSILRLEKAYNTGNVALRIRLARMDARLILSRLIQSGKVSARHHFEGSALTEDDDYGEHFTNILRAVKLTNKRRKRVFSPVDMMHEMLRCCPDVSERLLVIMVHYAICRALPDDFADSLLDSNLHPQHPHKLLSRRYIVLRNRVVDAERAKLTAKGDSSAADGMKEAFARVTSKLIVAGVSALIEHMLNYSDCNESLLQAAMTEGLTERTEVNIIAKILADLLKTSARRTFGQPVAQCRQSNAVLVKWISALCISWRDELMVPLKNGLSSIALLQQAVSDVVKQTEAIFSLGDTLRQAESRVDADRRERKRRRKEEESGDATMVDSIGAGPVAPYTIERLVF